jgi:hypothetical protein
MKLKRNGIRIVAPSGRVVADTIASATDIADSIRTAAKFMLTRKKKPKAKLEKSIEKSAVDDMREDGAMVAKLNLMGQKAWPDRLIFPKGAKIRIFTCWTKEQAMHVYAYMKKKYPRDPFMIEFKRSAEHQLSELQRELQVKIGEWKP